MSQDKHTESIGNNIGLRAVLDKALESYEKLPMLEIVFERLVRLLTTALRNLTSETVDITIKEYSSLRFSTYYNTIKPPCSIIVFKVIEWENLGLIVMDNSLVFTIVDLLFGGKKHVASSKIEGRNPTYIEQALIKQISEVMLSELSAAFDAISPATCVFDRLESNPNFAAITRAGDAVILLKLNIELDERGGVVDIVIPYATIEPIKSLLQQIFIGEKFGSDATWEESMLERVFSVDLPLEAVILDRPTKLSSVANLKVGDTIVTSYKKDEDVFIRSGGVNLFKGQVGKLEEKVAVNITTPVNKEE
jgi:flagellar motor switch protein FliM